MTCLRARLQNRSTLTLWLIVVALFVRAVMPTGYMLDASATTLSFTVCSDASGTVITHDVTIPDDGTDSKAKADNPCAFSGLAFAALGGTDALLLATALLFIIALGFAHTIAPMLQRGAYLRPPPQGPPTIL
jgi:hypothetical protein